MRHEDRARRHFAAHAPPFICHASRPKFRRHSFRSANARSRRYFDHSNLHSYYRPASPQILRKISPASQIKKFAGVSLYVILDVRKIMENEYFEDDLPEVRSDESRRDFLKKV